MSLTGLVLNVVFDYILVAVLKLGTLGAALGTLLSITVSMLIGLGYFLRHGHIRFCKPKANWAVLVKSCTNGSSEMLTEMSTGITTFLFNIIIMKYHGETIRRNITPAWIAAELSAFRKSPIICWLSPK